MQFANDKDLFDQMTKLLYSGVICDVLDEFGYRNQAMRENLRPLLSDTVIAGRAKTILCVDVHYVHENPYDMEIAAVDSIVPEDLVVVSTNQSVKNGPWGELLSTAAKMRGARGAVVDGLIRDTKKIRELGFPVYCTGFKPVDSQGRGLVMDYDCPVEAGGVLVHPGDAVFGDDDGIVIIPKDVIVPVVEAAIHKVESENRTRDELLQGKLLREVYDKYGVL